MTRKTTIHAYITVDAEGYFWTECPAMGWYSSVGKRSAMSAMKNLWENLRDVFLPQCCGNELLHDLKRSRWYFIAGRWYPPHIDKRYHFTDVVTGKKTEVVMRIPVVLYLHNETVRTHKQNDRVFEIKRVCLVQDKRGLPPLCRNGDNSGTKKNKKNTCESARSRSKDAA
jgi:hypothetical protein